jgi:RNA polymerase sigma-70 factor, ECF subfamily
LLTDSLAKAGVVIVSVRRATNGIIFCILILERGKLQNVTYLFVLRSISRHSKIIAFMDDINNLLLKAKGGDKNAYGRLYDIFYRRIYRYCYFDLRDAEQSQDICQETFIKAWRSLPSFSMKEDGTFQAYLFRIARNLMIDLSRKKKAVSIDQIAEMEDKKSFEEDFERKEDAEMIQTALDKLDETEREILVLRYFEELPFEEIAQVTGMNEGALRVRVHRILKKLKRIIES